MLLLQQGSYKVHGIGVMVQVHIKQNQTFLHLYSTCMENVPWSSKAEEYNTEPFGFEGKEEGEGGCCVSRLLWRLLDLLADSA